MRAADIDWRSGPAEAYDAKPTIRVFPRDVRISVIDDGQNLSDMLAYKPPKAFLASAPHVARLFPDPVRMEQDSRVISIR